MSDRVRFQMDLDFFDYPPNRGKSAFTRNHSESVLPALFVNHGGEDDTALT